MKFLEIGSIKDTASTVPPAVARQLLEASIPVINQQKKSGKIVEFYWIPGASRSVLIREAKSAEEIAQSIREAPVSAFMNYEIYPLADFNEAMKITLDSLKASEKMMPSASK
jgi:muconolactone delta-isomerase